MTRDHELTSLAGPPDSGLNLQSTDIWLVTRLEEVKEQERVTADPRTALTSAGAVTEIPHTLLSSTDTHTQLVLRTGQTKSDDYIIGHTGGRCRCLLAALQFARLSLEKGRILIL